MKKIITLALSCVLVLGLLAGCGAETKDPVVIKVGASITPHSEILAACKDALAEKGYTLEIIEFTDYVLPNTTLEDGDLDANYFQHIPYLEGFNVENGTHLVSAAVIHYEPMGIYAGQRSSLADIQEGDKIAVPNDGSNEARALLLLEAEGLIKLKEGVNFNATKLDIIENTLNLEIIELEAAQVALSLPDVAFGVINGNYALQAGLNAGTDALVSEASDSLAAETYGNALVVREGEESSDKTKVLVEVLTSDEIRQFIADKYEGAVVAK